MSKTIWSTEYVPEAIAAFVVFIMLFLLLVVPIYLCWDDITAERKPYNWNVELITPHGETIRQYRIESRTKPSMRDIQMNSLPEGWLLLMEIEE